MKRTASAAGLAPPDELGDHSLRVASATTAAAAGASVRSIANQTGPVQRRCYCVASTKQLASTVTPPPNSDCKAGKRLSEATIMALSSETVRLAVCSLKYRPDTTRRAYGEASSASATTRLTL